SSEALLESDSSSVGDGTHGAGNAVVWAEVRLAEQTWRVIIADESAKLNLLRSSNQFGEESTKKLVRSLGPQSSVVKFVAAGAEGGKQDRLRWEHWFEAGAVNRSESARRFADATQQLTLWGNGQLNVCRCDANAIDALWQNLFGRTAPPRLHQIRQQQPSPTTQQLIRSLGLRESQEEKASQWLTTTSTCHSVWIFCQTNRRVPSSLFVEWGMSGATREHRGYEY
ncbi:MAG: hypothetical protein MI861_06025, partial [Pirellulales bacterium]|nr:hypothetical protein [Pirellulales bacterium]